MEEWSRHNARARWRVRGEAAAWVPENLASQPQHSGASEHREPGSSVEGLQSQISLHSPWWWHSDPSNLDTAQAPTTLAPRSHNHSELPTVTPEVQVEQVRENQNLHYSTIYWKIKERP